MKKYFNLITAIFFISFFQSQLVIGQDDVSSLEVNQLEEWLCQKWVVSDLIADTTKQETKEEFDERKEMLIGSLLEFNADKTLLEIFMIEMEGTWHIKKNESHTVIETTLEKGEKKWTIHSISKDKLILSLNDAFQKLVFLVEE